MQTYKRISSGNGEICTSHLSTENYVILSESNSEKIYNDLIKFIRAKHENIADRLEGTQWVLISIDNVKINVNKYNPLGGSSYIELPNELAKKKAIINIKNEDDKCFLWAILSTLYPADKDAQRVTKYKQHERICDIAFNGLDFPTNVQNISKFVKRVNKLNLVEGGWSTNVYYSESGVIKPLSDISKDEKLKRIDLLYLKNKETAHYCWIKGSWKLNFQRRTYKISVK